MLSIFGRDSKAPQLQYGPTDWYDLLGVEFYSTWGQLKEFENELPDMRFMRAQTCWLEGTLDDLRERKRSVLSMVRGLISKRDIPDNELENYWPLISVDTLSPRLADNICQAYLQAPTRTFATGEGAESVNVGFDDMYSRLKVDRLMNTAYRSALFTNAVLLYWTGEEFIALTPEYFRIRGKELWVCKREGEDAIGEVVWDVWDSENHTVYRAGRELKKREPNPYANVGTCNGWPAVLLRLNPSNDTYGAGITEAAEINVWSNMITLLATRIAAYQSFSIGLVKNTTLRDGDKVGPGKFIFAQNPTGEAGGNAGIEFATPDGKFQELETYRRDRIASFERSTGLPGFLVDEGAGQPPTGAALQVLERTLNDKRKLHLPSLRDAERELVRLIEYIAESMGRDTLVSNGFEINYAPPATFNDPEQELAHDITRANNGLITPSALTQKYLGVQKGQSDADAVAMMQANKQSLAFLAPTAPVPEVTP